MNSSVNSGFRDSPASDSSWFDKLLVKLHITPSNNRKYINNVLRVEQLSADISKRCRNIGLNYSIAVDWANEIVSFERLDADNNTSPRHELTFNELLSDKFNPQMFVSFKLHENNS